MSPHQFLARVAFLLVALVSVVSATTVSICNDYAEKIHLSWDNSTKYLPEDAVVYNTQCKSVELSPGWVGAVYIGLVPNMNDATVGEWRDHDTKVELGIGLSEGYDYFDVDQERGSSVPVMITSGNVQGGCPVDKLAGCPVAWQTSRWEGGPVVQCRNDQSPQALAYFRKDCPSLYAHFNDDQTKVSSGIQPIEIRVRSA